MPLAQDIYNSLLEDPNLEIGANQTREEAAKIEAEQRARQYMNNVQALALATEPLNNSALKQLANFLKTPIKKISKPVEKITGVITKAVLSRGMGVDEALNQKNKYGHIRGWANKVLGENGRAFFNSLFEAGVDINTARKFMVGVSKIGTTNIHNDTWPMVQINKIQKDLEYRSKLGITTRNVNTLNEALQNHSPFRDYLPKEILREEEETAIGDIIHDLRSGKVDSSSKAKIRREIQDNITGLLGNIPSFEEESAFNAWHDKVKNNLKAIHYFNENLRSKDGTVRNDPDHFAYGDLKRQFNEALSGDVETEKIVYDKLKPPQFSAPWLDEMKEDREFPLLGAERETGFFLNRDSAYTNFTDHIGELEGIMEDFEMAFEWADNLSDEFSSGADWRKGLQDELDNWKDNEENRMGTAAPSHYMAKEGFLGPYHEKLYENIDDDFFITISDYINELSKAGWSANRINEVLTDKKDGLFSEFPIHEFGLLGKTIAIPPNAVKHNIKAAGVSIFVAPTSYQLNEGLAEAHKKIMDAYHKQQNNLEGNPSSAKMKQDELAVSKAMNELSKMVNKIQIHNDQLKNNPEQLAIDFQNSKNAWNDILNLYGGDNEIPPYGESDDAINNPQIYSYQQLADQVNKDLLDISPLVAGEVWGHLDKHLIDEESLGAVTDEDSFRNIRNDINSNAQFLGDKTGWGPEGMSPELEQRLLSDIFNSMKEGMDIGMPTEDITNQILDSIKQNLPEDEARAYFNDKLLPEFELAGGDVSAFKPVADTFEEQVRQDTPPLETSEPPSDDATEASVGDVSKPDLIPTKPIDDEEDYAEDDEEPDELPIEPTEEPEMREKTEEPKLDEGKLNELMDYYDFEQDDPNAQKLLDHYKKNPKKLDSDYEKNIIGNIISDKLESNKKASQEAETKEATELKAKQDKAKSLPHEKGHLDEYKNEDGEVSSIQATQHARELIAHYLEHKEDMPDEVLKKHGEALDEAMEHGADMDRIANEIKQYRDDEETPFGSPQFYEKVHDQDMRLASLHRKRNDMVQNPNHDQLRESIKNPHKLHHLGDSEEVKEAIETYNNSLQEIKDLGLDRDVTKDTTITESDRNAIQAHKEAIEGLEGIVPPEKIKDLTSHLAAYAGGETQEEKEQRELEMRMAAEGRVKNPKTGRWVKKENLDALISGFDTHDFGVVNGTHAGADGSHLVTDNDGNGVDEHYQIGKDGQVHFIDESSLSNAPKASSDRIMSGHDLHSKVLGQKHKGVIGEMKNNSKTLHVTPKGFANDNTPHGDASKELEASTTPTPTRTQGTFSSLERYMSKQITSVDSLINFVKDKDTHERFGRRKKAKELLERISREKFR